MAAEVEMGKEWLDLTDGCGVSRSRDWKGAGFGAREMSLAHRLSFVEGWNRGTGAEVAA